MAIAAGTLAAIAAISALAQAGGAGFAAHAGAEEHAKDRRFQERQWLQSLQDNAAARVADERRYQDSQATARRAELQRRPGEMVGLLGGLSNLSQGMARSNPLDVLGYLAR